MCEMFPASVPGPDRLEVSPALWFILALLFLWFPLGTGIWYLGVFFWYLVFDLRAQILPSNKVAIIINVAFAYPFHRDIPSGISDTHFSFTQMNRT